MDQKTSVATEGTDIDVHALIDVVLKLSDDPAGTRRRLRDWAKAEMRGAAAPFAPTPPPRRGPGRPRKLPLFPKPESVVPTPPSAVRLAPADAQTTDVDLGDYVVFRGEKWLDSKSAARFLKLS